MAITDRIILPRELDGRFKLTAEKEAELREEIKDGVLNDAELGLKYGVSRSKVYFMRNPKQKEKKDECARKYQKAHYDKDVTNEAMKKNRKKKQELVKRGLL